MFLRCCRGHRTRGRTHSEAVSVPPQMNSFLSCVGVVVMRSLSYLFLHPMLSALQMSYFTTTAIEKPLLCSTRRSPTLSLERSRQPSRLFRIQRAEGSGLCNHYITLRLVSSLPSAIESHHYDGVGNMMAVVKFFLMFSGCAAKPYFLPTILLRHLLEQ